MYLTPYGGVNEIGGNCFLLRSKECQILLDCGRSFKQENIYFAGFLQPRIGQGLTDFLEFDTLPRIQGLYDDSFNVDFGLEKQKIDGVFLSHAHMDHYGNLNLLHESIPIHMGETAKLIIQSIQETSRPRFGRPFIKSPTNENPSNVRTFRTGDVIQVADLNIFPVHVDHSIPGSYGFVVENRKEDFVIGYSGDMRLHGWRKDLTKDFIRLAKEKNVNTLLMEGTNVSEDFEMDERKVQKDVSEAIGGTNGLAIANYSLRDIDRFRSFYFSAKENSRKLLINFKQAHLLKTLQSDNKLDIPPLEDPIIEVYKRPKSRYYKWEQDIINSSEFSIVCSPDFNQEEYIFHCDFWNFTDLIDIQPQEASYFYSHGDPFSEEGMIDFKRMKEWIRKFKLKFYQFHASGHAPQSELKRIVEEIAPEVIIPIHSEEPEKFKELTDLPIILPSKNHKIALKK